MENLQVARKKPSGEKSTRWSRPRYAPKRKVCAFCADKSLKINYKDPDKLRTFISDRAKIVPRRRTGTCAKHQRSLAVAIKRARHLALLPYVPSHMRKTGGIAPTTHRLVPAPAHGAVAVAEAPAAVAEVMPVIEDTSTEEEAAAAE